MKILATKSFKSNQQSISFSSNSCAEEPEKRQMREEKYIFESSWKEGNLKAYTISNKSKKKKERPLPATTIALIENPQKALEEFAKL